MAADLIMPTLPGDPRQSHVAFPERPYHARSISYQLPRGPELSLLSTSDQETAHLASMPASPRHSHHSRHIRPLYIPAVLRPNEFPSRVTTPKARSPNNGAGTPDSASELSFSLHRSSSSVVGLSGLSILSLRLSGRPAVENGKDLNEEWDMDLDLFPVVTSLPTRAHWKADCESSVCDDPTCKRNFSYFTRRHHCRRCGNIFCDAHSSFAVPLDQDANFNPRAAPSRTCNHCFEMFRAWYSTNSSQVSSSASSDVQNNPTPATPVVAGASNLLDVAKSPDAAASVPRDWTWSTF